MIRFHLPALMTESYGDGLGCHARILCTEFFSEAPRTEVATVQNTTRFVWEVVVLMARVTVFSSIPFYQIDWVPSPL